MNLDDLRKIAENATPGPWRMSEVNNYTGVESAVIGTEDE